MLWGDVTIMSFQRGTCLFAEQFKKIIRHRKCARSTAHYHHLGKHFVNGNAGHKTVRKQFL
jgi:thioredoxin-related protein